MSDSTQTPNVRQMRETIERQAAELAELKQFRQDTIINQSGITGPALKAVLKDIDRGDYQNGWTVEDIQSYASDEYDWSPAPVEPEPEMTPAPDDTVAGLHDEAEAETAQLDGSSLPPAQPTDVGSEQAKAQAEGRHLDAARLGVESVIDNLVGLSGTKE